MSLTSLFKSRLGFVLCALIVLNAITLVIVYGPWGQAHFRLSGQFLIATLFAMAALPGALIGSIGSRFFPRFVAGICVRVLVAHPAHKIGLLALGLHGMQSNWWAQCCFVLASVVSFGTGLLLRRRSATNAES